LMNGESAPNLPEKQAAALVKAKPVGQRRPAAAALMPAVAGVPRRKRRVGVSSCLVLAAAVGLVTVAVIGVGIAVVILLLNQGKMPTGADIDVEAKKQAAARKKPLQLLNPPPIQKDAKLHLTHVGWFDWTGHDGLGKGTVTALASDKITVNGKNHPLGLGMHPNRGSGSQVRFPLRGLKARLFTASVAVNDTAAHGSQSPLTFAVLGDEKLLWESKPVQMPHKVQKLSVNVAGIDTLELRVHCPGPHGEAHAVCVDPFITTSLTETELDDIVGIRHAKPLDKDTKLYLSHAGWSDWIGYNGFGKGTVTALETGRIFVDGVNHPLGLGMHPQSNSNSQVKFPLRGLKARMFTASVAVNDTAAVGSQSPLTFVVLGDGKALWESKPERMPHVIQKLSVNVSGIEVLELRVNCPGLNGGAHAVWLDPFITTSLTETEMDDAVGLRR